MTPTQKTAERILAEHGQRRPTPRLPPIEDLADLARAYIKLAGEPRETLADGETLYVSLEAAREYGAAERIHNDEVARRQLTDILIDASQAADDPTLWRARSRSSGLDISARVAIEGRLLVVTTVNVRSFAGGGRKG